MEKAREGWRKKKRERGMERKSERDGGKEKNAEGERRTETVKWEKRKKEEGGGKLCHTPVDCGPARLWARVRQPTQYPTPLPRWRLHSPTISS